MKRQVGLAAWKCVARHHTGVRGVQGGGCALSSLRSACRHKGASLAAAKWILKEVLSMKDAGLFLGRTADGSRQNSSWSEDAKSCGKWVVGK